MTNFSEKHLIEWYETNHKDKINDGWEIFKVYTKKVDKYTAIKIRRKYNKTEIAFNEDGYKYEVIYPKMENTKDYLFFTKLGYNIQID